MPQAFKKSAYNTIVISPEQLFCDPTSGATPKLLGLLRTNHAFLSSTATWNSDLDKILQILNMCSVIRAKTSANF